MNEEIEYAEMLEIPVSTVSVTEKRRKFRKNKGDLKEKLISKVNDKAAVAASAAGAAAAAANGAGADYPAYSSDFSGAGANAGINASENAGAGTANINANVAASVANAASEAAASAGAGINANAANDNGYTQPYYSEFNTVTIENDRGYNSYNYNADGEYPGGAYAAGQRKKGGFAGKFVAFEFAAACVLCATIFMTNVFLPKSGMNVFFRSLNQPKAEAPAVKKYSDFTLRSVVNDFAEVPLTVSDTGVLTFKGKCCVYPAIDGTLSEITKNENGTYDVKISHTDDFYGLISGLDTVYYETGEKVYANIPVGYTRGENDVQVTMYSGGEMITSFAVDEENCLVWAEAQS